MLNADLIKFQTIVLLVLCWNGASGLVDGKLCISMPLSRNEFTLLTHVTFLAFELSINILLTLLTSWLLALYARSTLCIMANCMCIVLQHSSAKPS